MKRMNSDKHDNKATGRSMDRCGKARLLPLPGDQGHPEPKAEQILKDELARQRSKVRRMRGTDHEVDQALTALRELMQEPAFVSLLKARGFATIPQLLHHRLKTRP